MKVLIHKVDIPKQPDHHDADHPPMTFEWEFANDSWVFAEGERTDQRRVAQQPLLLKTRELEPNADGHHRHVDYGIYFYTNSIAQNRLEEFDVSSCYAGGYHKFVQCMTK